MKELLLIRSGYSLLTSEHGGFDIDSEGFFIAKLKPFGGALTNIKKLTPALPLFQSRVETSY